MEMLVSERPRRLADHVYSTLRQAILAGELQPGERLRQEQLRASFAVSASPVREALNRLASDGLVSLIPHRGATVVELSVHEIDEIYEVREALDPYAARLVAARASDAELDEILRLQQACERDAAGSPRERFESNRRFHRSLYVPSRNEKLIETLDWLWDSFTAVRMFETYITHADDVQTMHAEHAAIAVAMLARDGRGAAALVRRHVVAARRDLRSLLAEGGSDGDR